MSDWEDDDFEPTLPGTQNNNHAAPDSSKFADEDADLEPPVPEWQKQAVKAPEKKVERKAYEDRGAQPIQQALDDPEAEKLRRQRLVEEADLKAAQELFGAQDLKDLKLEEFVPRSAKDYETLGRLLAATYALPHASSAHYKLMLKALLKAALAPADVQLVKDTETCLAGIRSDKLREERTRQVAAKGAGKKKTLNTGRDKGSAGLEDYQYDEPLDDETDFM